MILENDITPAETLEATEGLSSYAPLPTQLRGRRRLGRFANSYRSHKTLVITLSVIALIFLGYGSWALVKASRNNPDKLANTSDNSGNVQKTVVVLPGQDQILSINAKLKVNNATTVNGDLAVNGVSTVKDLNVNGNLVVAKSGTFSGNITANNISATNISGSFSGVYVGNGSALTNLNASNITTGTLSDSRLSTNVTLQGNAFNGPNQRLSS